MSQIIKSQMYYKQIMFLLINQLSYFVFHIFQYILIRGYLLDIIGFRATNPDITRSDIKMSIEAGHTDFQYGCQT